MFERFSSGYYLGRLYVEPHDGEAAAIARDQHARVNEQLYASGEGVEPTDLPLVMKLETTHFTVGGDERVPEDTLAVPRSVLEETTIRNPPTLREVFLAKADRARQLLPVAEGTASTRAAVESAMPDWMAPDEGGEGEGTGNGGDAGAGPFDGPDGPAGI